MLLNINMSRPIDSLALLPLAKTRTSRDRDRREQTWCSSWL